MESNILASEYFCTSKRHYFLDFKLAANNTNFIQITRSDERGDGSFKRNHVIVFQDDFHFLIQAFSSLFQHASYLGKKDLGVMQLRQECAMEKKVKGIKGWEPDLRPREKLLSKGASALTDAELIALLIGAGTVKETAVELSERILKSLDNDLENLVKVDYQTLGKFTGMGMAKCSAILGAMELVRRLVTLQLGSTNRILGSFEQVFKG